MNNCKLKSKFVSKHTQINKIRNLALCLLAFLVCAQSLRAAIVTNELAIFENDLPTGIWDASGTYVLTENDVTFTLTATAVNGTLGINPNGSQLRVPENSSVNIDSVDGAGAAVNTGNDEGITFNISVDTSALPANETFDSITFTERFFLGGATGNEQSETDEPTALSIANAGGIGDNSWFVTLYARDIDLDNDGFVDAGEVDSRIAVNRVEFEYTISPEPSSALLTIIGLGALAARRKRKLQVA